MSSSRQRFTDSYRVREAWLFEAALPLWASMGVDPAGGFHEKIGQDGQSISEPRRTRVIARQIYCFAAADRMGWPGDGAMLVAHGMAALERVVQNESGLVIATTGRGGTPIATRYDFYDHAFALFALAQAATLATHKYAALRTAHALQDVMEATFRHPEGGFYEDRCGTASLRANPHMHMLEACMALAGVDGAPRWRHLADDIVALALARLIDPNSGAMREFFDTSWRPLGDADGQAIEPGHQFEWAWLLAAWNADQQDEDVARAASRLAQIGRERGIGRGGVVVDLLDDRLFIRVSSARIWPQCERLKCHVEWALASEGARANEWWEQADAAMATLTPFLQTHIAGLWFDRLDELGRPVVAAAPASTLYHLVCALETARQALGGRNAAATLSLSSGVISR